MSKYRCTMCGHIYDEAKKAIKFNMLKEDYCCPSCGAPKDLFENTQNGSMDNDNEEPIEESKEVVINNGVRVSNDNKCIERIVSKCIDCGQCKNTCKEKEGFTFDENSELCLGCGQCVQACPVGALGPKDNIKEFKDNIETKDCIAYVAPATRVAFAELFGMEVGTFSLSKLVGLLRQLGFKYVYDVSFGADLTICEEAYELIKRIKDKINLPMLTSCCPSWVKYCETFYPSLIPNLSTCKSPIGMEGIIIKEYYASKLNMDVNNIYTVAITPCTSKKYEISLPNVKGTDLVLTMLELKKFIDENNIKYEDIKDSSFDSLEGSMSGTNFGSTSGVMIASLRTLYFYLTKENIKDIPITKIDDNLLEIEFKVGDLTLNCAIVNKLSKAKDILEEIKNRKSKYQFIEIMNCEGGCIGGGGQPIIADNTLIEKQKRIQSLLDNGNSKEIKYCHNNPELVKLYTYFLQAPGSKKCEELLHTHYQDRSVK